MQTPACHIVRALTKCAMLSDPLNTAEDALAAALLDSVRRRVEAKLPTETEVLAQDLGIDRGFVETLLTELATTGELTMDRRGAWALP